VALAHEDEEHDDDDENVTATIEYEGTYFELVPAAGQTVEGTTSLEAGSEVVVVMEGGDDSSLLERRTVKVAEDGRFVATFDLSEVPVGALFQAWVEYEQDSESQEISDTVRGTVVERETDPTPTPETGSDGETPQVTETTGQHGPGVLVTVAGLLVAILFRR
jgi:hypothetical protein